MRGSLFYTFLILSCFLHEAVKGQLSNVDQSQILKERKEAQQRTDDLFKSRMNSARAMQLRLLSSNPSISVNNNAAAAAYTPAQLVENIFVKGGACSSVSNVTYRGHGWSGTSWSAPWNTSSPPNRGLGFFSKEGSVFEMSEGLILSTGNISSVMGPNNAFNGVESAPTSSPTGDGDLTSILPSGSSVTNVSILEFDFVPVV